MADVGRVQGPKGPQGTPEKEEGSSVDSDKFKEAMKLKAQKISELDPEEQKKRKQREEEEEETEEAAAGPTTPASQVTPFSLESKAKSASPLEMQTPAGATGPLSSAQPTAPGQPLPSTTFFLAPSEEEINDESGMWEENAIIESFPSQPPTAGATLPPEEQAPLPQLPAAPTPQEPIIGQTVSGWQQPAPAASQAQPQQEGQPPKTGQKQAASSSKTSGAAQRAKKEENEEIGAPVSASKEEDREKILKQSSELKGKELPEKVAPPKKEEVEEEIEETGMPPSPLTPGIAQREATKEKKTEKEEGAQLSQGAPGTDQLLAGALPAAEITSPPATPYAYLHPQIMNILERMVGVITVMSNSGLTETTITLNSPQFASSVFFGAQIIIQEYSTAPKAFNIQLNGNPQALDIFQGNADDLMAAFQYGNYNFKINRLDTGLLREPQHLIQRKEDIGKEPEAQKGGK